ncbi:MAG: DHHA1 domain-containing protein [Candidatus Bathyarchaeia archaeon]
MDVFIFTHGDTDGICAGAIVLSAYPDAKLIFTNPYRLLEDLDMVSYSDTVIICDISLPENCVTEILKRFSEIADAGELIYIDHHPLPESILTEEIPGRVIHNVASSTSELAYFLFQSMLDHNHGRTAIYGAIADYLDRTPLIQELLKKWDDITIYFETGILSQGIESLKGDNDSKKRIVHNLANNMSPSFDEDLVRLAIQYTKQEWKAVDELKDQIQVKGRVAFVLSFPFSLGKTATYIRMLTDALIGMAGEKRKDKIDLSLRTSDERVNLNRMLREITPKLCGSGGGHPKAAGARIPQKHFNKFLEELNKSLASLAS